MKKINLMCPINPLGYGVAGKNICKSLEDLTNVYYSRHACQTRDEDYHQKVASLKPDEIFVYPELTERDLSV